MRPLWADLVCLAQNFAIPFRAFAVSEQLNIVDEPSCREVRPCARFDERGVEEEKQNGRDRGSLGDSHLYRDHRARPHSECYRGGPIFQEAFHPSSLDYEGVLHVIRCRTPQRHSGKADWLRCFCCSSRSCALPLLSFRGRSRPICLAWLSFVPPAKGCVVAHASQMPCPGCPGERWACTIWVASSRFSSAF